MVDRLHLKKHATCEWPAANSNKTRQRREHRNSKLCEAVVTFVFTLLGQERFRGTLIPITEVHYPAWWRHCFYRPTFVCLFVDPAVCLLDKWTRSSVGRLKTREWKMRYGQNCKGGKCRSGKCGSRQQGWKCRSKPYGTPIREYIEKALSYFVILVLILLTE